MIDQFGNIHWLNEKGQPHREDGPAREYINGFKSWWYQGKYINCTSQEEFERIVNLIPFE